MRDKRREAEDRAKYQARAGMAKVALEVQRERQAIDKGERPLYYATRMAQGHSSKTLERWARNSGRKIMVSV